MRELFGTALNRFLINDALQPETAWSGEAGVIRSLADRSLEVVVFVRRTSGTIDQETVQVDGKRLRRRINLSGSRTVGVEIAGQIEPDSGLEIEGHITLLHGRPIDEPERDRLTEKPAILSTVTATQTVLRNWSVTVQGVYTGRAWGLDPKDVLTPLPRALQLNARISFRRYMKRRGVFAEFFVRGENLFDTLVLPQLGLPAPGRSVRGGVSLSF
jgi:iron complex outermembrane receptor protein